MYQTSVKRVGKFEAKLNLYLIKESQNQCTHIERLERNGRSWKSEKPVEIVKELQAEGNGWGESSTEFSWAIERGPCSISNLLLTRFSVYLDWEI